jgi:hypothetical protein
MVKICLQTAIYFPEAGQIIDQDLNGARAASLPFCCTLYNSFTDIVLHTAETGPVPNL